MLDPISQAMMTAGLGIMGTRGTAGISRGGLMGIQAYTQAMRDAEERKEKELAMRERELRIKGLIDEEEARRELASMMSDPNFFMRVERSSAPLGSDVDNSVADAQQTVRPLNREEIAQKILGTARSPKVQDLAIKSLLSAKGVGQDGTDENEMVKRARQIKQMYAEDGRNITNEQAYALAQSTVLVNGVRFVPAEGGRWRPLVPADDVATYVGEVASGKAQGEGYGKSLYGLERGVDAAGRPVFTRQFDILSGLPTATPGRFQNFNPSAGTAPQSAQTIGAAPASPTTVHGMPDPDAHMRNVIADELRKEADPNRRAMLERELSRLGQPSTGMPSTGIVRPGPTPEQEIKTAADKKLAEERAKNTAEHESNVGKNIQAMSNAYDKVINVVLPDIDRAIQSANMRSTGLLGNKLFKHIEGSDYQKLETILNTIKNSIAFQELKNMRFESPTGAALGQVAIKELEMLSSAFGEIRQTMDEKDLKERLAVIGNNLRKSAEKLRQALMAEIEFARKQNVPGIAIPEIQPMPGRNAGREAPSKQQRLNELWRKHFGQ